MTVRYRIITLELMLFQMEGQDSERLAGVMVQYPPLAHLDLTGNFNFREVGTERLAGGAGAVPDTGVRQSLGT